MTNNTQLVHELRIQTVPFEDLLSGVKTGEVRNSDRGFKVGDSVLLNEVSGAFPVPTGRQMRRTITHIQTGYGLPDGIVVLSYAPAEDVRAVVESPSFQARVQPWMLACFGSEIAADQQERNHRFLEEALELVQSCGATAGEAHQLVDYVYGRAVGERSQEVGGVMVTLAALCLAQGMDMHEAAETELARVWTKVEQIRAKQLAKPAIGPLPGAYPDRLAPSKIICRKCGGANFAGTCDSCIPY